MPNIEIKAKCSNIDFATQTAKRLKTDYLGTLHQIDTYFSTQYGRLKLREINGEKAELIPYYKEYSTGPMKSDYSVLPVKEITNAKSIFDKILGTVTVVDKKREVYLIDNVRVHLDEVKELGTFIEFEAVYDEKDPINKEKEVLKVEELMDAFKINNDDLLDRSYIDYLLDNKKNIDFEKFKVLYFFENSTHVLSELKRVDLPESSPVNERFHWLVYNKENREITRLGFSSMGKDDFFETREFSAEKLKFNNEIAHLTLSNKELIKLKTMSVDDISTEFIKEVINYFQVV